jgi:hypothetical protein
MSYMNGCWPKFTSTSSPGVCSPTEGKREARGCPSFTPTLWNATGSGACTRFKVDVLQPTDVLVIC